MDTDALDEERLGGGILSTVYPNNTAGLVGEARAVEIEITQGGGGQDANIYEIGMTIDRAAATTNDSLTE